MGVPFFTSRNKHLGVRKMEKAKNEKTEGGRTVERDNGEYSTDLTEELLKYY